MGKLIYNGMTSLDGYTVDRDGVFDWAAPSEEVHAFVNDLLRPIGTHLYGRRMYETMRYWETNGASADDGAVSQDFAGIWRAAEKVVYSRTLDTVDTARTTLAREFDADAVRRLKDESPGDLMIGGTEVSAEAVRAGLVDEYQQFLVPVIVGGGKPFLPDGVRVDLTLLDERRFASGTVYVHYRAGRP